MPSPTKITTHVHPYQPLNDNAEADALFFSMGDGAITTDEFGRITRINPAALQMLGYRESELLGKPFISTIIATNFDGQVLNVIDRPITKAYLTGKPVYGKILYYAKKGRQLPVAVTVSPIMVDGRPVGAIQLIRDITLELEVDRMKSEFISLASHQLRTPLSAIKTYTHMLSDGYMGGLNKSQKECLETIISASNRMNELISTLLNVTRIESGTIAVNPKLVNIEEVVAEVMPELKLMADAKNINLTTKVINKNSTRIRTDTLIVKEVVTNLVSNAVKYTSEGGEVKVQIRPRRSDIMIAISDNGWGIPAHTRDKVFSKFFRGPNIINRETTGTGLGLYLVKGLVETLKGKIWFKSEEGQGTTFFVTLPRANRSAKPKNSARVKN